MTGVQTCALPISGTKNSMGAYFDEIGGILDRVDQQDRVGVCFDTSHGFAAGYDLRNESVLDKTLDDFDDQVGLSRLKIVHLNDSKGDLGSKVDRHEHIGLGFIGEEGFKAVLRHKVLKDIPLILETPVDERRDDKDNLMKVRELAV